MRDGRPLSRPGFWLVLSITCAFWSGIAHAAPTEPGSVAIFVPGRARCAARGFVVVQKCGGSGLITLNPKDTGTADASRLWQLVPVKGPGGLYRIQSVLRRRTPNCPSLLTASTKCGATQVSLGSAATSATAWKVECKKSGNRSCTAYVPARNGCPRRYLGFSLSCGNSVAGLYKQNEAGAVTMFDARRPQNAVVPQSPPPPRKSVLPTKPPPPTGAIDIPLPCPSGQTLCNSCTGGICIPCPNVQCAYYVYGICNCAACNTGYSFANGICAPTPSCPAGFGPSNGVCVACNTFSAKARCTAYSAPGTCVCTACSPGFRVSNGGCVSCGVLGCASYSPGTCSCLSCQTGWQLAAGRPGLSAYCQVCKNFQCASYSTNAGCRCTLCKTGYELNDQRVCEEPSCFPSDAVVQVKGAGPVRMDRLEVGHSVLTMGAGGRQAYEEVVFFGHRDAHTPSHVTVLTVQAGSATNATRTLRLTGRHYMPTLTATGGLLHKYAADVAVGDRVLMVGNDGGSVVGHVVKTDADLATGLFNPYTKGGFIVVDGVLASAHSEFILDAWTPAPLRHLLPHIYQAAFKPVTWLYALLGPLRMAQLTDVVVPLINTHFAALQMLLASCALALGAGVWRASRLPVAIVAAGGKSHAA